MRAYPVLLRKDLRVELRSRDTFAAALTVALLVALVSNVAFVDSVPFAVGFAGAFWAGLVFAAQVGLARTFVVEAERGTLQGLLAGPAPSLSIYASKLTVQTLVMAVVAVVVAAALLLFYSAPAALLPLPWLLVVALGVLGIGLVTTLAAAMAMHGRNWMLLVPLLSLPSLFPVLAAAVPATTLLLSGAPVALILPHLRVLAAFDIVFLTAAWLLVPTLLEP